jgi:hypothetical protein
MSGVPLIASQHNLFTGDELVEMIETTKPAVRGPYAVWRREAQRAGA